MKIFSEQAWSNIKRPQNRTPLLSSERLNPFCKLNLTPKFKINSTDSVFTVGSCFARNLEKFLANKFDCPGYRLVEKIKNKPDHNIHAHNKYNPLSILQQLRWSMNLDPIPDAASRFIEIDNGKVFDLFLHMDPGTKEASEWLFEQTQKTFLEGLQCKIWIITFGLIEVWKCNETGLYITEPQNIVKLWSQHKKIQERWHKRFSFEILPLEKIISCITETILLLKRLPNQPRIITTVSPIPMAGTFSSDDCLVANCLSKSSLRAAVSAAISGQDCVDYFPSYEHVIYSSREKAWQSDGIHPTDDIIRHIMHEFFAFYAF